MNRKTLEEILAAAYVAGAHSNDLTFRGIDLQEEADQYGQDASRALYGLGYAWLKPDPEPPAPCSTCGKIHPGIVHSEGIQ